MKKAFALIALVLSLQIIKAQSLYFPPATGTVWDTISPSTLGWCQPNIDTLYSFLQAKNTDAFMVLKDGKIVLEKYFGTFTADSFHLWNSASKSLTAMLVGIGKQNGVVNIDSPATKYLGPGWTAETPTQEEQISLKSLLTMTSGTNPAPPSPCTNIDTNAACLTYLSAPGIRWAYHTGAYRKLENVLSDATSTNYNILTQNYIGSTIGMSGIWVQQEFVSPARSAARFGLLALNRGIWASDTLLQDTAYFTAMTNTSQPYNLSYGYLWWLNGKASYMAPGSPIANPGYLIPNAPADMICALGKDDQKIYVVPSTNMVVVRFGNAADSVADAATTFDNQLWGYIDSLGCTPAATGIGNQFAAQNLHIWPNPTNGVLWLPVTNSSLYNKVYVYNLLGAVVAEYPYASHIDISQLAAGFYIIHMADLAGNFVAVGRVVKE